MQKVKEWEYIELLDEFGITEALQKLETLTKQNEQNNSMDNPLD